MRPKRPSEALNEFTATFTSDQIYCDAIMSSSNSMLVGRILVYYKWARLYLPHIQDGLIKIAMKRFPKRQVNDAEAWTALLVGGMLKDICLVPYLTLRGVFSEAGFVIRRSLEHVGVLAHFWRDPSKAEYLGDSESREFYDAFVRERDARAAQEQKDAGTRKRFAALWTFRQPASQLYKLLSVSDVHGGTPLNVISALAEEGSVSCSFIDRRDPKDETTLSLLHSGIEILCVEISALHGQFGKQYEVTPAMVSEGGRRLTSLLSPVDNPSPEMIRELVALNRDLGLSIISGVPTS